MIIDCEVHLLHPDGTKADYLADRGDTLRPILHEHPDFHLVKDLLSVDALLASMDQNNIQTSVIMGMPWSSESALMENNAYIAECVVNQPDRFKGMMIPPLADPEKAARVVEEMDKDVFIGVKILPRDQKVHVNDPKLEPLFEVVEKLNLPLMIHTDHPHQTDTGDTPFRFLDFLQKHPRIKVLAPHLGGSLCLYAGLPKVRDAIENVLFIVSVSATMELVSYASQLNPDNLIFGTDFPFNHCHNQSFQIQELNRLDISKDVQEKILYKNAMRFFETL